MDNAKIHKGPEIRQLCREYGMYWYLSQNYELTVRSLTGVRLEYLPPYSPDLNPIEEAFSKIKAHLRREGCPSTYNLLMSTTAITSSDAEGYFTHAGYV